MVSDDEQLSQLSQDLERRRASGSTGKPRALEFRIPSAMTDDQESGLKKRQEHADKLNREAQVRLAVASLERQRGDRYVDCRLANFEISEDQRHGPIQRVVIAELKAYCQEISTNAADAYGVFLYGPCGTGKDHLAMAVARAFAMATSGQVKWVCGAQLFRELRDSFDTDLSEGNVLSPYTSAPLLWISDPLPAKGELTDYQANSLYSVIEKRYSAKKPMLVTANLDPGEADLRFGPAIARRLRETTLQLHCNWPRYAKKR